MIAFKSLAFDVLDSTNTEALNQARAGAAEGLCITAKRQGAGRGRQGRTWQSPLGNLYVSFILRPTRPESEWGQLSFLAALSVGEALGLYGMPWQLKWPNDVMVQGAKISGLLLEREADAVVLGIGVNIAYTPEVEGRKVTSLFEQGGTASVDDVLLALQSRLAAWYDVWTAQGFAPVQRAWLNAAYGVGSPIRVVLAQGQEVRGVFETLDSMGALLLRDGSGALKRILAGDVFF